MRNQCPVSDAAGIHCTRTTDDHEGLKHTNVFGDFGPYPDSPEFKQYGTNSTAADEVRAGADRRSTRRGSILMPDLDATDNCPLAPSCATCSGSTGLSVQTISTSVGVCCVTLCRGCTEAGATPGMTLVGAVHGSLDHCMHLGIDADQMAQLMQEEAR